MFKANTMYWTDTALWVVGFTSIKKTVSRILLSSLLVSRLTSVVRLFFLDLESSISWHLRLLRFLSTWVISWKVFAVSRGLHTSFDFLILGENSWETSGKEWYIFLFYHYKYFICLILLVFIADWEEHG